MEYHEILEDMLKSNPETDGIFASSDFIAAQLLQICHKLHIRVPEDLKIVPTRTTLPVSLVVRETT